MLGAVLASCSETDTVIAVWDPPIVTPLVDASTGGMPPVVDTVPDAAVPALPAAFYLETEDGVLSGGFGVGADVPPADGAASGGFYIEASEEPADGNAPGGARAIFDFNLQAAGDYVIWGRIHSPDALHNRFWFRVDEQTWFLWRISTGDVWYWDDLHNNVDYNNALVFPLSEGAHRLEIANGATLAQLDRLYLTAQGDVPPGNNTVCDPPHSIQVGGACRRSCGSYGVVSCIAEQCDGLEQLDSYDCTVCCLPP